jgi:ATP-dependent Lon protease
MDYINTPVSQNIPMDENLSDILMLKNKLVSSAVPSDLKNEVLVSIDRLEKVAKKGVYSSEYENVSKYLDCVTRIPWGILSKDNMDIHNAKQVMDASHYGMDGIKNSILDYLAAMQLETRQNLNQYVAMPSSNLSNLSERPEIQRATALQNLLYFCFVGLQGVG